jgi:hypothetical protein
MKLYMKRLYDFLTLLRATIPEVRYLSTRYEGDEDFCRFANLLVSYKFSKAGPYLRNRLAATMILRHRRLMHFSSPRARERRTQAAAAGVPDPKKPEATTVVTKLTLPSIDFAMLDRVFEYALSTASAPLKATKSFPPLPKISGTGTFTCLYCHQTLASMSNSKWR